MVNAMLMEKQKRRQVDKECGGVRHRSRTGVLMYSFGPATVIKQHFAAFSSICFLSLCFINDKHGRQHKQMSAVLANQDLLDAFCGCFAFGHNFTWKKAGIILGGEEKKSIFPHCVLMSLGYVTSNKVVVM